MAQATRKRTTRKAAPKRRQRRNSFMGAVLEGAGTGIGLGLAGAAALPLVKKAFPGLMTGKENPGPYAVAEDDYPGGNKQWWSVYGPEGKVNVKGGVGGWRFGSRAAAQKAADKLNKSFSKQNPARPIHEDGQFWVAETPKDYVIYETGSTASTKQATIGKKLGWTKVLQEIERRKSLRAAGDRRGMPNPVHPEPSMARWSKIGESVGAAGKSADGLLDSYAGELADYSMAYVSRARSEALRGWNRGRRSTGARMENPAVWIISSGGYTVPLPDGRSPRFDDRQEAQRVAAELNRTMGGLEYFKVGMYETHEPGRRSNPGPAADAMYESFHGAAPTGYEEIIDELHVHGHLAELGSLVSIKVTPQYGRLKNRTLELDFSKADVLLCSNETGTQLYFRGGNQEVSLKALGFTGHLATKDLCDLGIMQEITYKTAKGFDDFKTIDYYHQLGEVSKDTQPTLLYDTMNHELQMAGGSYVVLPAGITD